LAPPARRVGSLVLLPLGAASVSDAGFAANAGEPAGGRAAARRMKVRPIEDLVAQVEQRAAQKSERWPRLGGAGAGLYAHGRFDESVRAWQNAIRLNGANRGARSRPGRGARAVANGVVTVDAKAAFDRRSRSTRRCQNAFLSRFGADQDEARRGRSDLARFLAHAPPGAPWVPVVHRRWSAKFLKRSAPHAPGPNAATSLRREDDPDEQKQMIGAMVARLADVEGERSDVDGWLRLVRAYTCLASATKAQGRLGRPPQSTGRGGRQLRRVDDLAKELGLQS